MRNTGSPIMSHVYARAADGMILHLKRLEYVYDIISVHSSVITHLIIIMTFYVHV
jgi:hypothetical protein